MKTTVRKTFVIFSIFSFLTLGASMNAIASDATDHDVLAMQFKSLAKEMQNKVAEQKEIVKHKPSSSYFGRNGQRIKSHIAYKIRKYEKAAAEYMAKASYHHELATAQTELKTVGKPTNAKQSS